MHTNERPMTPGQKFGRLTHLGHDHREGPRFYDRFRCDCGTEKVLNRQEVKRGKTRSCGCLQRETISALGKRKAVDFDLSGRTFGRWKVLRPERDKNGHTRWVCWCLCGTVRQLMSVALRHGKTASCGCRSPEITGQRSTTHGHCKDRKKPREYRIWQSMLNRCRNPKTINYEYYGALGVKVCERWHTFENFLADMGPIPKPLSIDRVDPWGDYTPENCRLATPKQQAANRRT